MWIIHLTGIVSGYKNESRKRWCAAISKRGEKGLSIERIYRLLYNRELYLMAYQNIYANNGIMTKGITIETASMASGVHRKPACSVLRGVIGKVFLLE